MSRLEIGGKHRLSGDIRVHGAKNSVLPILAATVLSGGVSEIHNCPGLSDVHASLKILRHLGCSTHYEDGCVTVDSSGMTHSDIPDRLMREMRSSVIFLGAILARTGEAVMSYPGGCELGPRPIDLHLAALRELGATVEENGGNIVCRADRLRGREISLSVASVGATENIMLAATAATGTTRIQNAAREPEIVDLQNYLLAAGARVGGAGSSVIEIEGGHQLSGARHDVIPDRIVAATYLTACAAAGGDILLKQVCPAHISTITAILREAGCEIWTDRADMRIRRSGELRAVRPIRTQPYPGFPTDAQALLMSAMTTARGPTVFVENIFENRYRHVGELMRMGADIKVEGRVAVVCGVPLLHGADVEATDLRGGAALVVAALGAEGRTTVREIKHIDRGYEGLEQALRAVGADIIRTEPAGSPASIL